MRQISPTSAAAKQQGAVWLVVSDTKKTTKIPFSKKQHLVFWLIKNNEWSLAWWLIPVISAQKGEIRRCAVQVYPKQKVSKTPSQPIKQGVVVPTCHPSHAGGINTRIEVQASQGPWNHSKNN
jgi:hypothetical protein